MKRTVRIFSSIALLTIAVCFWSACSIADDGGTEDTGKPEPKPDAISRLDQAEQTGVIKTTGSSPPASQPAKLTKGGVVLTFDDRNFDDWVNTLSLFDEFNVKATFFIHGKIDGPARMAIAQLKLHGHAIGSHSVSHLKAVEYFEANSAEKFLQTEIDPQMREFESAGVDVVSFAYPMSRNNTTTDKTLLKVFRHLRTGRNITEGKRFRDDDAFFVKATEVSEHGCLYAKGIDHAPWRPDRTYAQIDGALERAAANDEIIVLYAHRISETGTRNYLTPEALMRVISKAKSIGLQFYTFDQLP
ncbi:polysaccharide deacetylase family protein [Planctomycetes bacterium K23_9]|uniref:Polysaccharide deacetylase n=1 Tax=Stieleria marina TaxID=1930275 RepID=A0A517NUZ8_9BACT|nr:Polysaccharide deacetylase [Planctomycetes bacterium K23_9]